MIVTLVMAMFIRFHWSFGRLLRWKMILWTMRNHHKRFKFYRHPKIYLLISTYTSKTKSNHANVSIWMAFKGREATKMRLRVSIKFHILYFRNFWYGIKCVNALQCQCITTVPSIRWFCWMVLSDNNHTSWISLVYNINIFVHFYGFNMTESKTIYTCDRTHTNNKQSIQKLF